VCPNWGEASNPWVSELGKKGGEERSKNSDLDTSANEQKKKKGCGTWTELFGGGVKVRESYRPPRERINLDCMKSKTKGELDSHTDQ